MRLDRVSISMHRIFIYTFMHHAYLHYIRPILLHIVSYLYLLEHNTLEYNLRTGISPSVYTPMRAPRLLGALLMIVYCRLI
jgi:hypothetical protein